MSGNGAPSGKKAFSKTELLRALRRIKRKQFSSRVVARVKRLESKKKTDFVKQRLGLSAAIIRLDASLMRDIRKKMEAESGHLRAGIQNLEESQTKLENAAKWAAALGRIVDTVGKVVSLI